MSRLVYSILAAVLAVTAAGAQIEWTQGAYETPLLGSSVVVTDYVPTSWLRIGNESFHLLNTAELLSGDIPASMSVTLGAPSWDSDTDTDEGIPPPYLKAQWKSGGTDYEFGMYKKPDEDFGAFAQKFKNALEKIQHLLPPDGE
jgi:hypothetical protein